VESIAVVTSEPAQGIPVPAARGGMKGSGGKDQNGEGMKLFFQGNQALEKGLLEDAIRWYTEAVELMPDFATAYHERGLAHKKLGEYDKACDDFTAAIKLKSGYSAAYTARAAVWIEMLEYDRAVEDASEAIRLAPDDSAAYNIRANAYQHLGDVDQSFDDFEKAGEVKQRKVCIICMENTRGTRLHPCLHSSMCGECAKDLHDKSQACPLCGVHIEHVEFGEFMKTFAFDENMCGEEAPSSLDEIERQMREAGWGDEGGMVEEIAFDQSPPSTPSRASTPGGAGGGGVPPVLMRDSPSVPNPQSRLPPISRLPDEIVVTELEEEFSRHERGTHGISLIAV